MTDIHDDLDDLDKVWCQEDPLLSRDVEVDFGVDDRPVFDDDPVVEDRPEVIEELGAYDQFEDEENVVALHGHEQFRSARVSRRKTTTLLHAIRITIAVGIGAIGVTLTLVILMGRLLTARQLFFMAESILPAARRGPGAVPAAIPLANSRSEVLGELRDGVESSRRLDHALPGHGGRVRRPALRQAAGRRRSPSTRREERGS